MAGRPPQAGVAAGLRRGRPRLCTLLVGAPGYRRLVSDALVQARGLRKRFGEFEAVRGIDL
ncbi:MAG: hypothetical protein ACRDRK_05060, partial [Pseudonocardia sp.]